MTTTAQGGRYVPDDPGHVTGDLLRVWQNLLRQLRGIDILTGWQIWKGYMWPYVLLAYLSANLIVGLITNAGRDSR